MSAPDFEKMAVEDMDGRGALIPRKVAALLASHRMRDVWNQAIEAAAVAAWETETVRTGTGYMEAEDAMQTRANAEKDIRALKVSTK